MRGRPQRLGAQGEPPGQLWDKGGTHTLRAADEMLPQSVADIEHTGLRPHQICAPQLAFPALAKLQKSSGLVNVPPQIKRRAAKPRPEWMGNLRLAGQRLHAGKVRNPGRVTTGANHRPHSKVYPHKIRRTLHRLATVIGQPQRLVQQGQQGLRGTNHVPHKSLGKVEGQDGSGREVQTRSPGNGVRGLCGAGRTARETAGLCGS